MRIFPEEFGYYFSEGEFDRIYDAAVDSFKEKLNREIFIKEASAFREGTDRFELINQNQLEPGVKRYQWVDPKSKRMIITAYSTGLEIIGIQFGEHESFESDNKYTVNKYSMPFKGKWFILWGGADSFLNYHYPYSHQRYAYDFIRKETGMSHSGERENLASYYAFGAAVTAPARGRVVRVLTGIPDNPPYGMNTDAPEGNAVIIEHDNNEYSLLAHLKNGSLNVSPGDTVERGEVIAQCGNSGASDTPHLHFHVMNGIEPHHADALRIRFEDGREPVQGETVYGDVL